MKRTPLRERKLPDYTSREETANMVTHIIGAGFGVVIAAAALFAAISHGGDAYEVVSAAVYGFTVVALFTVSSVYHGLRTDTSKKVLQVIDHCTIFLLIAGTYTPILLSGIRLRYPVTAWVVLGIEWGAAAVGAVFNAIDLKNFKVLSMICYICMGWLITILLKPAIEAMTLEGFLWLFAGGLFYTVGAVLFLIGVKKRYYHTAFHILVDIACLLQAVCIVFYIL